LIAAEEAQSQGRWADEVMSELGVYDDYSWMEVP
jgi:hypothetical protein